MSSLSYDPNSPFPLELGGFSPQQVRNERDRTGMARLPATAKCEYCHESLVRLHGKTPQGNALGFFLRGKGPWCLTHYHAAWAAWKRGLYYGKTELNGY
jgi:hypothetical protein